MAKGLKTGFETEEPEDTAAPGDMEQDDVIDELLRDYQPGEERARWK